MTVQDFPITRTVLDLLPADGEWTEVEYHFFSERGGIVELSDGHLEIAPLLTERHQLISARLSVALFMFVTQHKLGQVRCAPLPVRLWPGKIREPDIVFMSAEHAERIGKYWGVPDLAVEIVSETDPKRDRVTKVEEYASAGILEYWIIDPETKTVDVLRLSDDGVYQTAAHLGEKDTLTSPTFPNFQFALTDLFAPA
jgi:Uma2 family endonuclease